MIHLEKYSAGKYIKHPSGYYYFHPSHINEEWKWEDPTLNLLLEKAAIKLGELNAFARLVPNIDLFIQLHVTKEAVVSSRIEGTQTNIDEALLEENEIDPERRNDWKEVNNYIRALKEAIIELDKLPISTRLLKQIHKSLLSNVRGAHKLPGEFRSSQNWIGGNTLLDAVFIPPHQDLVPELMGDLEKFMHNENLNLPALIKIAIAHYQFETIHPFLDGNGRIGRLLITLFLVDQKILQKPLLYLSAYFEKNKGLYYDNLTFVRTKNDMSQWLKYFLAGVATTAENATQTLNAILELKERLESTLSANYGRRSANAGVLLNALFKKPIIQVSEAQNLLKVSFKAANDIINELVLHGVLTEMTGQSRNRIFVFDEYLNLFKS
jgi:Fic family protein